MTQIAPSHPTKIEQSRVSAAAPSGAKVQYFHEELCSGEERHTTRKPITNGSKKTYPSVTTSKSLCWPEMRARR
jgi:hypothetical protein